MPQRIDSGVTSFVTSFLRRLRAPACAGLSAAAAAQEPAPQQPPSPVTAPPVIVTASRTGEDPFEAPWAAELIDEHEIRRKAFRTTPQALREVTSVQVQETSPGQGSPFIRGFTGYLNLFLIDGVRLNNSTFRAGPNQYWNTVDLLSVDRLEVVKGPASALYGSDAVGGTVQAITRDPYRWPDRPGSAAGGATYVRYATAEDSIAGRAEISASQLWTGGSRTGVLLGGDAKAFGDVEGGNDIGEQPNTGYSENALDLKLEHWLDDHGKIVFLHQRLGQDAVPRTHATTAAKPFRGTAVGTDLQRDLDQDRHLTYLQYHRARIAGPMQAIRANVSWHEQEEVQDRIRGNGERERQGFTVGTLGAWLQFESDTGSGALSGGVDYWRDSVDSFLSRSTPQPGDPIQGPVADDATYDLLGVFLQDRMLLGESAELLVGGRWTWARADADEVRDPSTNQQIGISDDWSQLTGSARLRIDLVPREWNVYGGVSQGFRAPNLSDLSSFETARSGEVEIPAPGLEPEHYLGYEVGTKVQTGSLTAQGCWYYTDIDDQILRFPTGTTTPLGEPIVTKDNVGEGYVQGAELAASVRCTPRVTVFGAFTWQYGRVSNFESGGLTLTEEYVSRMMPVTTRLGVRWEDAEGRFWAETEVVRAEDADKLSSGDQRDTQRIPPGGTPSWTLWHARAGCAIGEATDAFVQLENITDVDYRVHGSGTNSPGMNLVLGMHTTF